LPIRAVSGLATHGEYAPGVGILAVKPPRCVRRLSVRQRLLEPL